MAKATVEGCGSIDVLDWTGKGGRGPRECHGLLEDYVTTRRPFSFPFLIGKRIYRPQAHGAVSRAQHLLKRQVPRRT